jgi:hypothetical protein
MNPGWPIDARRSRAHRRSNRTEADRPRERRSLVVVADDDVHDRGLPAGGPEEQAVPASVRAQLVEALESSGGAERDRTSRATAFVVRVAGRLRRPDTPMGPAAVRAARLTRQMTGRFRFDDDVADVFVALAAAIAEEASDMWAEDQADAARRREQTRRPKVSAAADYARTRARLGSSFVQDVVPAVATGLAAFVPGLAVRRPLAHPSVAVGAAVAGGLASSALVGTSAVPVALAMSVVTEAAETYAQGSVLVNRMRAEGHEPAAGELVEELAEVAGRGVLGRSRPEVAAMARTAALPRLSRTLERRVGVRVATLATLVGPALVEGGLTTWGLVKARRHRFGRGAPLSSGGRHDDAGGPEVPPPPSPGTAPRR